MHTENKLAPIEDAKDYQSSDRTTMLTLESEIFSTLNKHINKRRHRNIARRMTISNAPHGAYLPHLSNNSSTRNAGALQMKVSVGTSFDQNKKGPPTLGVTHPLSLLPAASAALSDDTSALVDNNSNSKLQSQQPNISQVQSNNNNQDINQQTLHAAIDDEEQNSQQQNAKNSKTTVEYKCNCGNSFNSKQGLKIHIGKANSALKKQQQQIHSNIQQQQNSSENSEAENQQQQKSSASDVNKEKKYTPVTTYTAEGHPKETLPHLLLECPCLEALRNKYQIDPDPQKKKKSLHKLLSCAEGFNFITEILQIRKIEMQISIPDFLMPEGHVGQSVLNQAFASPAESNATNSITQLENNGDSNNNNVVFYSTNTCQSTDNTNNMFQGNENNKDQNNQNNNVQNDSDNRSLTQDQKTSAVLESAYNPQVANRNQNAPVALVLSAAQSGRRRHNREEEELNSNFSEGERMSFVVD